jgi:hypothetical protein
LTERLSLRLAEQGLTLLQSNPLRGAKANNNEVCEGIFALGRLPNGVTDSGEQLMKQCSLRELKLEIFVGHADDVGE